MSLLIGDNLVVSIHYTLTDESGNVIDSSADAEPLSYLHGAKNIIPGLEQALTGKTEGAKLQTTVEPAEAYGEFIPELIQTVDKSMFQGVESLQVGMAFEAQGQDESVQRVVITAINDNEVTVDANHPLAGATLNFDVEVVNVREATSEEVAHGHVH